MSSRRTSNNRHGGSSSIARNPRGSSVSRIDFPTHGTGKTKGETIFPAAHGGIRWTFRDELGSVGFFGCTSESRTCLMELEPFWKFDRREQPTSQSFSLFSPSYLLPCPVISVSPVFPFRVPSKIPVSRTTLIWFRSFSTRVSLAREKSAADGRRFRKTFLAVRSWKLIRVRRYRKLERWKLTWNFLYSVSQWYLKHNTYLIVSRRITGS